MPVLVGLDFETYYSRQFSLSRLTIEEYVRDPQFEAIMVDAQFSDGRTHTAVGPDAVAKFMRETDWSDKIVVGQNVMFDGFIMGDRYGVHPLGFVDTLGMSRALFPHELSHSLKSQAERAGLGAKGDEVLNALGKRYHDFTPEELERYATYCRNDVDLTLSLFHRYMAMGFPAEELKLIDLTIRMFTDPVLQLNQPLLESHLKDVKHRKDDLLNEVRRTMLGAADDVDRVAAAMSGELADIKSVLMSNDRFAAMLQELGVEPPTKISPTTGKTAWAFAKTDEALKELGEHPDERVQALVAARLGNKTTLEETRTERFIHMAGRGKFPIPLRYYGAHSGRWCLTGDHEVLTPTGWVRLDAWRGEPVRQWDAATKQITWCQAPTMSAFHTTDPVVEFSGKYHRAVYTQEHRLPARKRHTTDGVRDITAARLAELAKAELYVAGYAAQDTPQYAPHMLQLVVAMHADGYNVQDAKNNMVRFRFARARKIERMRALLAAAQIPYVERAYPSEPHVTTICIRGADAPEWLRTAKRLPDWFYQLGGADAAIVVAEIPHWDGTVGAENSFTWVGKDPDAAMKYATLGHLCGYRALTRLRHRRDEGWSDTWSVAFVRAETVSEKGTNGRVVPFDGVVYCPTVDTGYFLCRRLGTIFVTGNSGEQSVNLQNLPARGVNANKIKKSIEPPPGHVFIDCDSAQIEARVLAWLAGQDDLVQAFRDKEDIYSKMASKIYGRTIDRKRKEVGPDGLEFEPDKTEGQVGKSVSLGCGFGVGHKKLKPYLKAQAGVEVSEAEAKRIIDAYRHAVPQIVALWKRAGDALVGMLNGQESTIDAHGLIRAVPNKGLTLPNGLFIQYPDLRAEINAEGNRELTYLSKGKRVRIYGGKVVENFTQAVARLIVAYQMRLIAKRYRVVLTVHDAIAIVAPEAESKEARAFVEHCMSQVPKWAIGLPIACESGMGKSYGDC